MEEYEVPWPTGMSDQDPAARDRPLVFNPQGFLVAILEDADRAEQARAALADAGFADTSATTATTARTTSMSAEASTNARREEHRVTTTMDGDGLRRVTGWLLVIGAVAFAVAATVLSSTFDWPDILREPPEVVLPAFVEGGTSLVWTWFAVAWTYAILLVPILLLPAALGRRDDPVLRAATFVGAASVLLALIGFLRWVFVVPALADSFTTGDPTTRAAVAAAWTAQHQFGGALLGEHLGQLLAIGWSVTVSVLVLRTGMLWRWLGWAGLVASVLYLFNQGDILATAVAGFPVFDLAGFIGSSLWAIWVIALGVAVLRAPIRRPATLAATAGPTSAAGPA